jgi:copper resistance protein B
MSTRAYLLAAVALLPLLASAQSAPMDPMPAMHDMQESPPAQSHEAPAMDHSMHATQASNTDALPPNEHVPPPPPAQPMHTMSPAQMAEVMQMDDAASLGMLLFDRLERTRSTRGDYASAWEAQGAWGGPIDRVWLKTEGERDAGGTRDGRIEALWGHAWTSFWDTQLGIRHDFGQGPTRQWLAAGVQGLAPYGFETQATFYLGEQGRTALRVESSYELLFTQRLILEPRVELNVYGKDDPPRGVSSGLSDAEAGLRLRYEFSRKFAPYVGVNWTRRFGTSASASGEAEWHARETTWLAGVRVWF